MSLLGRRRANAAHQQAEKKADRADLALRRLEIVRCDLISSAERLAGILAGEEGDTDAGPADP